MKTPLIALAALAALCASSLAAAADLTLEVRGLESSQGTVMVAVFADAEGWLRQPVAVARQSVAGQQGGVLQLTLKDLPAGRLAFSVFHDLNDNGRMDRNAIGVPLEPFAFSNNAVAAFGPPRFEQASFEPGSSARLSIQLN